MQALEKTCEIQFSSFAETIEDQKDVSVSIACV